MCIFEQFQHMSLGFKGTNHVVHSVFSVCIESNSCSLLSGPADCITVMQMSQTIVSDPKTSECSTIRKLFFGSQLVLEVALNLRQVAHPPPPGRYAAIAIWREIGASQSPPQQPSIRKYGWGCHHKIRYPDRGMKVQSKGGAASPSATT